MSMIVFVFAIAAAVAGIGYGLYLTFWVMKLPAGSKEMQQIAQAIQEGAAASRMLEAPR